MKLEDGMYIRTKCNEFCNQVVIRKIVEIDKYDTEHNSFWIDNYIFDTYGEEQNYLRPNDVEKSSFNIIDLIEIGDYVNGYPATEILSSNNKVYEIKIKRPNNRNGVWIERIRKNEDIKSIVTKEQFKNIEENI